MATIKVQRAVRLLVGPQLPAVLLYVTNDSISDTDIPPNIGICKNGFGGFADGVRVFKNDEDARLFKSKTVGRCERIAPGVYFWSHPT